MLIGTGHAARVRVRALLRTVDNCDRTVASRRLPLPLVCPFLYSVPCRVSVKAGGSVWTAGSIPISGWPLSGLVPADGLTKRINCTEVQPSQKRAALIGSGAFSGARLFLRGEKKKKKKTRKQEEAGFGLFGGTWEDTGTGSGVGRGFGGGGGGD